MTRAIGDEDADFRSPDRKEAGNGAVRAAAIIAADPPGLMSGDLSRYCFEKLPRPIFPLDDVPEDALFFRCCKHGTP